MPLPKCSQKEVYDKKLKKCIVIGSDAYKTIVKNNPDAFKHYAAKIAKATKAPTTCSVIQVYNKHTKRCVAIGSQSYRAALKKDPTVFNDQKNKINMFFGQKAPKSMNVNNVPLSKMFPKSKSPPSKSKSPQTVVPMKKKLLKPVAENKVLLPKLKYSSGVKQLFTKKVSNILKKSEYTSKKVAEYSDAKKLPPYIFIKKPIHISVYFFDYYNDRMLDPALPSVFKTKRDLTRKIIHLKFKFDNISSNFYKYVLKRDTNPDILDTIWLLKMQKYIANLSNRERYALYSYTKNGDVYVNILERGMELDYGNIKLKPLFYEFVEYITTPGVDTDIFLFNNDTIESVFYMTVEDIKKAKKDTTGKLLAALYNKFEKERSSEIKKSVLKKLIENLGDTISRVIKKSPPTTKPMVVFRGVMDCFFAADNFTSKYAGDEVYYNKGFVSTSINYKVALETFTNSIKACCFKVITILPGTRCIPLIGLTAFPDEAEILLDRNTKYIIRDKYIAPMLMRSKDAFLNFPEKRKMKISDIIIG